jgi:acyl-CoA thioesterase I
MRAPLQITLLFALTLLASAAEGKPSAACGPAPVRIVALGTSLTAGYGLGPGEGYIDDLEAPLKALGCKASIENAGVSGDTSAGGLARLDWTLASSPQIVLVELGGNDALRGLPPRETENNLDQILAELTARKLPVLFMGMRAPPNLGKEYGAEFNAIYPRLAQKYRVTFYPFVLDGVAAIPSLNQADGIHPNAKGAKLMAAKILPVLLPLVREASSAGAAGASP